MAAGKEKNPENVRAGKHAKAKGKKGELELAAVLRAAGYDCHRGAQHKGGPKSPDVEGLPGIHIECKRVEKLLLYDAMAQAVADCGADEIPCVMHRRNNCEWLAILKLNDFLTIYREWEASGDDH